MHNEEQHLFPALQITYILASTTLQHISLELNGLRLSARVQAQGIKAKTNYSAHKRHRLFHMPPNYRRHLKS